MAAGAVAGLFPATFIRYENSRTGRAQHANAARDEMTELVGELQTLASTTCIPTPVMEHLSRAVGVGVPTIAEGSAQIPLNWRGLAIASGAIAGVLFLLTWLRLRTC